MTCLRGASGASPSQEGRYLGQGEALPAVSARSACQCSIHLELAEALHE
jgi:hypothetical protein